VRNVVASFSGRGVRIHPTAIVDRAAELGVDVEIGPYAVVEAGVRIGDRTRVMASAFITGDTDIAGDCEVHIGAVVGHTPQIRDLRGPYGSLVIGPRTVVREHVTIHRASREGAVTVVGADNFLMAACHVAHDCRLGSDVTIANGALLAGCVTLGDRVFLSGNVVVHQHVRIGDLAMVGRMARVGKDVPPFMLVVGTNTIGGLNVIGMRRAGMSPEARQTVRRAYAILYRSGLSVSHAVDHLRQEPASPEVDALVAFIGASQRGVCGGRARGRAIARDDSVEAS